jgi:hypothetical protein
MDAPPPDSSRRWRQLLHPYRLPWGWWFGLALVLVAADFAMGPYVQFAATFVVPVLLAAWYSGMVPALVLAFALPLVRLAFMLTVWDEPWAFGAIAGTAALRSSVFVFIAVVVSRLAEHERQLEREVEILEGLLPICMHCKSIRNDAGTWETLEGYISTRTPASFTHGLCSACAQQHYPEMAARSERRRSSGETPG